MGSRWSVAHVWRHRTRHPCGAIPPANLSLGWVGRGDLRSGARFPVAVCLLHQGEDALRLHVAHHHESDAVGRVVLAEDLLSGVPRLEHGLHVLRQADHGVPVDGVDAIEHRVEGAADAAKLGTELLGIEGLVMSQDAPDEGAWAADYLGGPGSKIGGGTDEIMKNIIGERVLGLPKEPGFDKSTPFKDLPRNG